MPEVLKRRGGRPGRRLGRLLLAALLAAPAAAAAAGACPACLQAGAAVVPVAVPPGTPLAGYGSWDRRLLVPDLLGRHPHAFWLRPHQGVLDPPAVRALVLEGGDRRLVWLALDLVAVDRGFTAGLAARLDALGLGGAALVVSASHTHSGPGAYLDAGLLAVLSVDREDAGVREAVAGAAVEAVRRAGAARRPARIGAGSAAGPPLTRGRLGHPVDQELTVLKVVGTEGPPIAVVWNYAIHGTMLGPSNLSLSGDVMGVASRRLERELGIPALFVNGAVGDVSPARHGLEAARADGGALAAAVADLWRGIVPARRAGPTWKTVRVALPPPHLSVRNCLGRWVPGLITVPLGAVLPAEAELTAAALADTAWVTMPGELQSSLGSAIKRERPAAWRRVFVAGVSNDYLGYFLAAADYPRPSYVACATLYGPEAGGTLARAAGDLLRALAAEGR